MRRLFVLTHLARRHRACQHVPIWIAAFQSCLTLEYERERGERARWAGRIRESEHLKIFFDFEKCSPYWVERLAAFVLAHINVCFFFWKTSAHRLAVLIIGLIINVSQMKTQFLQWERQDKEPQILKDASVKFPPLFFFFFFKSSFMLFVKLRNTFGWTSCLLTRDGMETKWVQSHDDDHDNYYFRHQSWNKITTFTFIDGLHSFYKFIDIDLHLY